MRAEGEADASGVRLADASPEIGFAQTQWHFTMCLFMLYICGAADVGSSGSLPHISLLSSE